MSKDPAGKIQVFFKTLESPTWNEGKSKTVNFSTNGTYVTIPVPVGQNANWTGTITGLRIDPLKTNDEFGIDDVCVGETPDNCLLHWSFDGAVEVTNPFFGWELKGIVDTWTDGKKWGGRGKAGDPLFRTELEFLCDP